MVNKSRFENVVSILSLILPAILVLMLTFFSPYGYANLQETWMKFWQFALVFYAVVFLVLLFLFIKNKHKARDKIRSTFQFWFVGFVLSLFSSIIARSLWDLAFFINYLVAVKI